MKVLQLKRLEANDALYLMENSDASMLGALADLLRKAKCGDKVFFNRNFHIEPSNICAFHCRFCRFRRDANDGYELSIDEIVSKVKEQAKANFTEVHIVGATHPERNLEFYSHLLKEIKTAVPHIHIKAFSAAELDFMFNLSNVNIREGLIVLKEAGLGSIPGGGAEIFDEELRKEICPDKVTSDRWLLIHQTAHELGIFSNATMLYGQLETYKQRIDHLERLRNLQDITGGFRAFIPLKFLNQNNELAYREQVSVEEDMKNYAISRIFLDNFPHIKAYWPAIGRKNAQLSLLYGVTDLDGTIGDTTKIFSEVGSVEQNPDMSLEEMVALIKDAQRIPVERDSEYNEIKTY
ncbi:MAG: CofH family radical SAM protein [Bacteroidota bacterium]